MPLAGPGSSTWRAKSAINSGVRAHGREKVVWEAEARSRFAIAQAEARRVNTQMLADAKNINHQARAQLQLDYQQAMAEANRNQQSARSAVQNEVMQQISRKVAGIQGAAQVLSQQDATNAQAQFRSGQIGRAHV